MKTTKIITMAAFILSTASQIKADVTRIAVLRIETSGRGLDPFITAQLFRTELQKNPLHEVVEKSEMTAKLNEHNLDLLYFSTDESKYKAGGVLNCGKVITGSIDAKNNKYYFHVKVYNVDMLYEENSVSKQFPQKPENIESYISTCLNALLFVEKNNAANTEVKEDEHKEVIRTANEKEITKEPEYTKTSLAGPRLGYTFLTGNTATLYKLPTKEGGYDVNPALFQFGYQFEAQYLANGDFQGLVEFIPTITGMDQSRIFPSITLLNGLRNTRYGIEVALGPTIYVRREAKGFYTADKVFHLANEWNPTPTYVGGYPVYPTQPEMINRTDSRGEVKLASGVILAVGKSFKSGNLNIPVNAYAVPGKNGWRYGISVGFNLKSSKQSFSSHSY